MVFTLSRFAAAVAMSAVYDYEPKLRGDPMVKVMDDFCKASLPALTPENAVLLKAFPFRKFLGYYCWVFHIHFWKVLIVPEWIPGLSRIRREASAAYALGTNATEAPYQLVQKRMVNFT